MSAKQKIVHCHGLSNLNLGIFVSFFDVCRASKPVPSINYDLKMIKADMNTVEPRLSGLVGTSVKSPDNRESG